jgi:hypothetical protein
MRTFKRSAVFLLVLSAFLPAAAPAPAQVPVTRDLPKFFGVFNPTIGAWSEYSVLETEGGKKSTMRNAIVGKEGDGFWYEVAITEAGSRTIVKMFLKGEPNNPENIQRLIMKNGDQPAQEMPREFVMMGRRMATHMFEARSGSSVAGQPDLRMEEVGAETVTVPAGTFTVKRNRIVDSGGKTLATADINDAVLPLGVVRSETEKVKLELIASGRDATSLITETAVMMKTPPGMPEGNPRGNPPGMQIPKPASAPATGGYGSPAAPASGGYGK